MKYTKKDIVKLQDVRESGKYRFVETDKNGNASFDEDGNVLFEMTPPIKIDKEDSGQWNVYWGAGIDCTPIEKLTRNVFVVRVGGVLD